MTATPGIVMARFIEAAHVESFLAKDRISTASGYWPPFVHTKEDRDGWDDQARMDNAFRSRGRASAAAVSRHTECMRWSTEIVTDPVRRKIIWAWAFCKANDRSFETQCKKNGWVRQTAYRRLTKAIEDIAIHFDKRGILVSEPDQQWMRHETHSSVGNYSRMEKCVEGIAINSEIPNAPYRTEKPKHLLNTPEAIAVFEDHLSSTNERRRQLQQLRSDRCEKLAEAI